MKGAGIATPVWTGVAAPRLRPPAVAAAPGVRRDTALARSGRRLYHQYMKQWTLVTLGLVTAAVIALVLWNLRSGSSTASSATAGPGDRVAAGAASGTSAHPRVAASAHETGVSGASEDPNAIPAALEDTAARAPTMENFLAGEVPRRVLEAAAGCYNTGFSYKQLEAEGATIELDYLIEVKAGQASIKNVKMTRGMGKPELEDCVVQVVGETQWEVAMTTSFSQEASYGINLLALKKFGEPLPHELDAEQPVNTDDEFGPLVRKRNQ
jgi:hypothetical protein